jgi:predicted ATPase
VGKSDLFDLSATLPDNEKLPIADLGYGVSQALPVLTQCSFCREGSVLLFEQPELHLHEGAATKLAHIFAETSQDKSVSILLETHSRDLFYETIRLINAGDVLHSNVIAYDVERRDKASRFRRIDMDAVDGRYEASHPWGRAMEMA